MFSRYNIHLAIIHEIEWLLCCFAFWMICVCRTAFTIYLLFVLGGGSSCILVTYGRTTNKVTITASYSMSIFLSNHVSNAAWVFYYWGLYDTSIVFSYDAKSSAELLLQFTFCFFQVVKLHLFWLWDNIKQGNNNCITQQ